MDEKELKNDIIEGRNAVIEALRAGRAIDKIFIAKGDVDKTLGHIASKARDAGREQGMSRIERKREDLRRHRQIPPTTHRAGSGSRTDSLVDTTGR